MLINLPISPKDEDYENIVYMDKEYLIFAIKNFIPKQVIDFPGKYYNQCPNCRKEVNRLDHYCPNCGKALKHIIL